MTGIRELELLPKGARASVDVDVKSTATRADGHVDLAITSNEEDVNKVLAGMAKNNNMAPEQLGAALGQMGVNIKTLRDRIRAQVVWQDVVRKKFRRDVLIADTPEQFANSVVMLLRDRGRREVLEDAARELVVTHYDWAAVASELEEALVQAAANARVTDTAANLIVREAGEA